MGEYSDKGQTNGEFRRTYKSDRYFLNGGDAYFLVGECNFRVHSYFFTRESPTFQSFLLSNFNNGRGTTIPTAIKLHKATSEEFERFLWVFYNEKWGIFQAPVEHWVSILKLSHIWCFPEVKALAVRELQQLRMPAVDRVAAYQNYEVDEELIFPLIMQLCRREDNLDFEEAQKLGMATAVCIYRGRELLRAAPGSGGKSPLPTGLDEQDAERQLKDILSRASIPKASGVNPFFSRPASPATF
ncbi:hypothetical protein AAF712_000309 [Marasmius tenuissimus]|uniref:BTB domain-containing protein n=1 Tax=Marasmius tenuissimus TaxID=585030 RepID=A0ABR3AF41_9AGAR|nr:hypothetical protein PM082_001099 [Marasmius tenuissimus]